MLSQGQQYVDPGTHLTQQNQDVPSVSARVMTSSPQADLNGRSAKKRQIKRTKHDYTCK